MEGYRSGSVQIIMDQDRILEAKILTDPTDSDPENYLFEKIKLFNTLNADFSSDVYIGTYFFQNYINKG
jgi:hypothetical protein